MATDFPAELKDLRQTLNSILGVSDVPGLRTRISELSEQASAPDLWDDPDQAQVVTSRLSHAQSELDRLTGMTRRLEPLERVKELGGAPVPFPFDVHAMIYSEDAPALEHRLHQSFASRRVNLVNLRREFFKVSLDEIRAAVAECFGHVTFVTVPQAAEYRQTLALFKQQEKNSPALQIA